MVSNVDYYNVLLSSAVCMNICTCIMCTTMTLYIVMYAFMQHAAVYIYVTGP